MAFETPVFGADIEARVLSEFRRAAAGVPAYRTLLSEHGARAADVRDFASFSRSCPLLSKSNTFERFPIDQLSVGGDLVEIAELLTSSGHGGRFSFGVSSRKQAAASAKLLDQALDDAFGIGARKTLAINCLPMGVVFSSERMTVATTSVREDMAVGLVEAFGHHFDQILLVGDPLFMKKLTDHARERGLDWGRHRINAAIGEEIFGEHFRHYVSDCLGLDVNRPDRGYVMSSFGVAELGLHLCYETPATIALRRAAFGDPSFALDLLGAGAEAGMPLSMIFSFNPARTFLEVVEPDADGYGRLTMSMLDAERTLPMLRYQTGDIARLIDRDQVLALARQHGVALAADLPPALVALRGREQDALPNGSHVGFYKDALYADREVARQLTGAFRVAFSSGRCTMHVQRAASAAPSALLEQALLQTMPAPMRPERLVVWRYAEFPFAMSLDYERKFSHYVPADGRENAAASEPLLEVCAP